MNALKYPNVSVQLTGTDGNAFAVIGAVAAALRAAGIPQAEVNAFQQEAMASDYDHLLRTCCAWVQVS